MDFERQTIKHRWLNLSGMKVFYREAGTPGTPVVLLLHGFPCSSHQYRYLLPALAMNYHVIAPDFPAFGFSDHPDRRHYAYTFEHYAETTETLLQTLGLTRFALYLHDYGAQVGVRLMRRAPERVAALMIQNSEAYYEEGRSSSWAATEAYWRDPSPEKREALCRTLFTEEGIRQEFVEHLPENLVELIDPGTIQLAWTQIRNPGVIEALLDLHLDYRTNVELYPASQRCFRQHRPPALILWGSHDQYYSAEAAMAYKNDLPDAEVHILDGGHWLLETHGAQVIYLVKKFLERNYRMKLRNTS